MANYISESWSADLDFGTGEWSVGAHINYPSSRVNLLTKTEQFDASAWEKYEVTLASVNQAIAPSGSGADLIVPSTSLGGKVLRNTEGLASLTPTPSNRIVVKPAGYTRICLINGDGGNGAAAVGYYDLVGAGAVMGSHFSGAISATQSITALGNGWYECILNSVHNGNATILGYCPVPSNHTPVASYPVFAGDGVSGILFADASGTASAFTRYQRVNTATDYEGYNSTIAERAAASGPWLKLGTQGDKLTATAHDGVTTRTVTTDAAYNTGTTLKATANYKAGKLWIEVDGKEVKSVTGAPLLSMSSRYNLLTYTEQFDNAAWISRETSVVLNSAIAPNGQSAADKVSELANSNEHWIYQGIGAYSAGVTHVHSCYVKTGGRTWAILRVDDVSVYYAWFNIATGVLGTVQAGLTNATITSVGDGWYRISVSRTYATNSAKYLQVGSAISDGTAAYMGDATKSLFVWGAQVEDSVLKTYQRVGAATDFDYQATLTIGNSRTLDAPFPGSITLLKVGTTVATPEQSLWMAEQEKYMFAPGAQITLPAATAVTDLTYDEQMDKWVAVQATHKSSFTGLVRTAVATPSAGSFSKAVAGGGVELTSRTTTSPGVDVFVPAYGLREELVRRAEAAAKASRTLTVFDFDAIAAQTDFALPVGWTATEVLSAGNSKREGATKDYTRLFDGFRETIRFAVAPGAAVWVQITGKKE